MRRAFATLVLTAVASGQGTPLDPRPDVATQLLVDTDGDGTRELIVVTQGRMGSGSIARHDSTKDRGLVLRDWIDLPGGRHMLLAEADIHPATGTEIVVATPSGTGWIDWQKSRDSHQLEMRPLAARARFTLRTGAPQLSPFVQDLNRDGRLDLLLPTLQGVRPFLQEAPADDGSPQFRAMEVLPVPVQTTVDGGSAGLDQELTGGLVIPQIDTQDLNGDDRPDLLTREEQKHAFWLQRSDGTFAPPLVVDLAQFQDSTPAAAVAPGSTLVLGDQKLLQRGDVDGDGIPDFVIAHRRKVWTFVSSTAGPQFTKARTQAVADDVTAMLVVDLDEDGRADLLTFQLQLPGIGALLLGLVQSIDIDVKAVGYRSENGAFANAPAWRRVVTLRIPPLLSLLSRQEELVQRFTDVVGKVRLGVRGAFTGEGRADLALVRGDVTAVDLFAMDGQAPTLGAATGRKMLRRVLFDDPDPVFDLERLFGLLSGFLDELSGRLVGDRQPVATLPLRDPAAWRLVDLLVGELDGAPRDEMVAVYDEAGEPSKAGRLRAYEALRWDVGAPK